MFGRDNIIVRKFSRGALTSGDIRTDFLNLIGIDTIEGFQWGKNENLALNIKQAEILRLVNGHLPNYEDGDRRAADKAAPVRNLLKQFLPTGEAIACLLSRADREVIFETFPPFQPGCRTDLYDPWRFG